LVMHEVSDYVSGQTADQWYVTLFDVISNKEVPNIDMLLCLLLKAFPFVSKRIVLLLFWNKTLSWTWYPWVWF
jgi:hypothetical protein